MHSIHAGIWTEDASDKSRKPSLQETKHVPAVPHTLCPHLEEECVRCTALYSTARPHGWWSSCTILKMLHLDHSEESVLLSLVCHG